jgi:CheY-like chemotaxis protein
MLTVLIVEDEQDLRDMAQDSLAAAGYEAFAARDAREALAILHDHPEIDLLFTDRRIAGSASGIDLAHAARQMLPDLTVLYATDRPDELLFVERPIDPTQVLRKPYQPSELQRAVGWLLQSRAERL